MGQVKPKWEKNEEFAGLAKQLVAEHPSKFRHVDPGSIIAYCCVNKKPTAGTPRRPYEITGCSEPEEFAQSRSYFVKMFLSVWASQTEQQKADLVRSILQRIDPQHPGTILSLTDL